MLLNRGVSGYQEELTDRYALELTEVMSHVDP